MVRHNSFFFKRVAYRFSGRGDRVLPGESRVGVERVLGVHDGSNEGLGRPLDLNVPLKKSDCYRRSSPVGDEPAKVRGLNRTAAVQPGQQELVFMPDTVEEAWFEVIAARDRGVAASPVSAASPQVAAIGDGLGISLASLRRFWAVAARWNSSRAPFGPRNRSRSSFRMRLRWANSISTFFRWQREAW